MIENAGAPATLSIDEDDNITTTIKSQQNNNNSSSVSSSDSPLGQGTDSSCGWFPTLQKTLWILSKLYHCVQVCFFYYYSNYSFLLYIRGRNRTRRKNNNVFHPP